MSHSVGLFFLLNTVLAFQFYLPVFPYLQDPQFRATKCLSSAKSANALGGTTLISLDLHNSASAFGKFASSFHKPRNTFKKTFDTIPKHFKCYILGEFSRYIVQNTSRNGNSSQQFYLPTPFFTSKLYICVLLKEPRK